MNRSLLPALLLLQIKCIFIKILPKQESCFVIRSEFSKQFVNFSYVVHSYAYRGNRIQFQLINVQTGIVEQEVKPDDNSFQRIFKFENKEPKVFRACFTNPDDFEKKVKFYVDNQKRTEYVEKDNLRASNRMLGEMNQEAIKIENKLFVKYIELKNRAEVFSKSQSALKLSLTLKFLFFLGVTIVQFLALVKIYRSHNVTLGGKI